MKIGNFSLLIFVSGLSLALAGCGGDEIEKTSIAITPSITGQNSGTATTSTSTPVPATTVNPSPSATSDSTSTTSQSPVTPNSKILPSNFLTNLTKASYSSLVDRIDIHGYAPTSTTGAYQYMYTRDSSVQVLALMAAGNMKDARSILRYIFRFGRAQGWNNVMHKIPSIAQNETVYSAGTQDIATSKILSFGGSVVAAQGPIKPVDSSSKPTLISGISVYLNSAKDSTGSIVATLRDAGDSNSSPIDSISVPTSNIPPGGGWVNFNFAPPPSKNAPAGGYTIELSTRGTKTGAIDWLGSANNGVTIATTRVIDEIGKSILVNGVGAIRVSTFAYRPIVTSGSYDDETDQTYSVLLAWARYVAENESDKEFLYETWPQVVQWANYYLTNGYLNSKLNLLFNANSDNEGVLPRYDLLSNSFASQALHELSKIAYDIGDSSDGITWENIASTIRSGINANLTSTVDGNKVYAQWYSDASKVNSGNLSVGYSFSNISPIAAEWYGIDPVVMKNTFYAFMTHASSSFYGVTMFSDMNSSKPASFLSTLKGTRYVTAKALSWEMRAYYDAKDLKSLNNIEAFLQKAENLKTPIHEGWATQVDGGPVSASDPGNQEHTSWFVYEMFKMYPDLASAIK